MHLYRCGSLRLPCDRCMLSETKHSPATFEQPQHVCGLLTWIAANSHNFSCDSYKYMFDRHSTLLSRRCKCCRAGFQMLVALIVIAISLAQMVPAPLWLGWYTLAFILLFDSAYAWSCESSLLLILLVVFPEHTLPGSHSLRARPETAHMSAPLVPLENGSKAIFFCGDRMVEILQLGLRICIQMWFTVFYDSRGPAGMAVSLRDPAAGDTSCGWRCGFADEPALQLCHWSAPLPDQLIFVLVHAGNVRIMCA